MKDKAWMVLRNLGINRQQATMQYNLPGSSVVSESVHDELSLYATANGRNNINIRQPHGFETGTDHRQK